MSRHLQSGAYLLEALVGILIFSLGVLGIVGLQAAALRSTSESSLRAEAVFAANQLIGQMWADNEQTIEASYSSAFKGPGYQGFAAGLQSVQGGAWIQDPQVTFDDKNAPSATSKFVTITIWWKVCQDTNDPACSDTSKDGVHKYVTSAVIGQNE